MPAARAECCGRHVRNDVLLVYKPGAIFYIKKKNWLVGVAIGIKRHGSDKTFKIFDGAEAFHDFFTILRNFSGIIGTNPQVYREF